jgi:hypothetical protein
MATNAVDPAARLIVPTGLPLAIIIISSIFFAVSIVTVTLRTFIRLRRGLFGWEDAFMALGTVRLISTLFQGSTK